MQQAKYMIMLVLGLMAMVVSYYIVIAIVVLIVTYFAAKFLASAKKVWNAA